MPLLAGKAVGMRTELKIQGMAWRMTVSVVRAMVRMIPRQKEGEGRESPRRLSRQSRPS